MRPLSVAVLAAVLILSALSMVPGGAHAASLHAPRAIPSVATVSITPTNSRGTFDYHFEAGYSNGAVYFTAYDPSGDTNAVVQINDINATRDNLANPVAKWTVNFVGGSYYNLSYYSNSFFQIPLNLPYAGTWNITIRGTAGGFASTNFSVSNYFAAMSPTSPQWLAGHDGTVLYNVNSTANNAPYANITMITVAGIYYSNTSAKWTSLSGFPKTMPAVSAGSFTVAVPADALNSVEFVLWANVSNANAKVSETTGLSVRVGVLVNPVVVLSTCPLRSCVSTAFADGAPVYVLIQAWVQSFLYSTAGANLTAKVQFEMGTNIVIPPGNPPTTLTTNESGQASVLFIASSSVFSTTGPNSVVVSLTDPVNSAVKAVTTTQNFFVIASGGGFARLGITLDNLQYYDGDTATATWELGGLNASSTSGWTVDAWQVWSTGSVLLASGTIASTSTQGTFQFTIPAGIGGSIRATVSAHNQSAWLTADAVALATSPTILLTPQAAFYLPGDTVTVMVSTYGSVLNGAQLWESAVDSSGNSLSAGQLSGNQVQFSIPKLGAPSYVRVSVAAQDPVDGILATATTTVDEGSGYVVYAGVDTTSNYIDGSFQPGQTISIHYQVAPLGQVVLPKTFTITVYPAAAYYGTGYGTLIVETASAAGTIHYTIPSSTPRGGQEFVLYAQMGSCESSCYAATQFSVSVNPNPSALSYEIGAGSGLTVAWLILLLIILILVIVGVLWVRRGRGGRSNFNDGAKPYTPSTTTTPSPPAAPPSTGPASSWNEKSASSGGGSSSSPPLPQPPESTL